MGEGAFNIYEKFSEINFPFLLVFAGFMTCYDDSRKKLPFPPKEQHKFMYIYVCV